MEDYLYHIWGLNCERFYHFSFVFSSFQHIFTFLLHFPYINQSSRNIYFNNIQNSFSSFFFLHVLKKLVWNPYISRLSLALYVVGWITSKSGERRNSSIHPSNHHDPSYLLFLPLSIFISVQFILAPSSLLFKEDSTICLAVLRNLPVEILKKMKSVGQKLYDFCGSTSWLPNQTIIWDDLFIFGSPEISQERPKK